MSTSRPILILGMHRSGTSCAAQMLSRCGLYLGESLSLAPSLSNLRGHFESREAVTIHDAILAASGGSWDNPPEQLYCPQDVAERMDRFVAKLELHAPSGWKDPRTVLAMGLWRKRLDDYSVVACFRNPIATAQSLSAREGWPLERGLALGIEYNRRLLDAVQRAPRTVWFDYDMPRERVAAWLEEACRRLDLTYENSAAALFHPCLRHHEAPVADGREPLAREVAAGEAIAAKALLLYAEIKRAAGENAAPRPVSFAADAGADRSAPTVEELSAALRDMHLVAQQNERLLRDVRGRVDDLIRRVDRLDGEVANLRRGRALSTRLGGAARRVRRAASWVGGQIARMANSRGGDAPRPRVCFLGDGQSGAWQVRGVQIAAARAGWTAVPSCAFHPRLLEEYDLFCFVKRVDAELVQTIQRAGRPVVYDILDSWRQPDDGLLFATLDAARDYFARRLALVDWDGVIFPNRAMRDDLAPFVARSTTIYHHARPGQRPIRIRPRARVIGYDGDRRFLGPWEETLHRLSREAGLKFVVNPRSWSRVDLGFAARGGEHGSFMARRYKSNVKLANFQAAGVPCLLHADEAAYRETDNGQAMFFRGEIELARAIDELLPFERRLAIHASLLEQGRRFSLANVVQEYAAFFSACCAGRSGFSAVA